MYSRGRYATTAPGAGCDGTKTAPPRFDADEILNRSIEDFLRACVLWCSLSFYQLNLSEVKFFAWALEFN